MSSEDELTKDVVESFREFCDLNYSRVPIQITIVRTDPLESWSEPPVVYVDKTKGE